MESKMMQKEMMVMLRNKIEVSKETVVAIILREIISSLQTSHTKTMVITMVAVPGIKMVTIKAVIIRVITITDTIKVAITKVSTIITMTSIKKQNELKASEMVLSSFLWRMQYDSKRICILH